MSISSKTFELPQMSNSEMSEEEMNDFVDEQLEMQADYALDYESMKEETEYVSPEEPSQEALDKIKSKAYKRRGGVLARIAQFM